MFITFNEICTTTFHRYIRAPEGKPSNGQWPTTGNWSADPERFGGTLRPISDAARAAGLRFLLWVRCPFILLISSLTVLHPADPSSVDVDSLNRSGSREPTLSYTTRRASMPVG